jgi:hypothetical protein
MLERIPEALKQYLDAGGVNEVDALYEYIRQHPGKRSTALAAELSLPMRTPERMLRRLKDDGRIRFPGDRKTAAAGRNSLLPSGDYRFFRVVCERYF